MSSLVASARLAFELFNLRSADRATQRYNSQLESLDSCRRWMWLFALVIGAGACLSYPLDAHAQLFDGFVDSVEGSQSRWFTAIRDLVRPTFLLLGAIEICWAAAIWVFERDNLSSFAVEVIKKIMTIGFFFVLLENAPTWIPAIFQTFEAAGAQATGILNDSRPDGQGPPPQLSTDTILLQGIELALRVWGAVGAVAGLAMAAPTQIMGTTIPGVASLHEIARGVLTVAALGSAIIVICYVIVAAQFFCLKVETAILFAAGAIFLGMGSSSWTRDYVSKYLNYAINAGVRMLVLILVLSLTLSGINGIDVNMGVLDMRPILQVTAAAILQAILATKVPELSGALLSGGAGFTAGGASAAAGGMVRSMASGAIAVANTAKGIGNLVKAANAGRSGGVGQHAGMSAMNMPGGGGNAASSAGSAIPGLGGGGGASGNSAGAAPNRSLGSAADRPSQGANEPGPRLSERPTNLASNSASDGNTNRNADARERNSQNTQSSSSQSSGAPASGTSASATQEDTASMDEEPASPTSSAWHTQSAESDDSPDDDRVSRPPTPGLTLSDSVRGSALPPPASSKSGGARLRKGSVPAPEGSRAPGSPTER